jgi:hypothetical protein
VTPSLHFFNVGLAVVAAAASALRGKRYVYGMEAEMLETAVPIEISKTADAVDSPLKIHRFVPNEAGLRQEPKERLRRTQSET